MDTPFPPGASTDGVYRSYLVRFWQSNERGSWRASAQCVQSGATVMFGDVASLLAFLQTELVGVHRPAEPDSTASPTDPAEHTAPERSPRSDQPPGDRAAHTPPTVARGQPADPLVDRGVS